MKRRAGQIGDMPVPKLNSLERILALLDVFKEDHLEWTPDELMAELGYSRPTLYRYLKILKETGLVTSMPSGGFALGPRVVELDFLMRKSDTLVRYAQRRRRPTWKTTIRAAGPCRLPVAPYRAPSCRLSTGANWCRSSRPTRPKWRRSDWATPSTR